MGCSPSKGKLFSKQENPGSQKAPFADEPQDCIDSSIVEKSKYLKTEDNEQHPTEDTPWSQSVSSTTSTENAEDYKKGEINVEILNDVSETKGKGKRRSSANQRPSVLRAKVDFTPHMVRAHQAAYTFLNPNISKYEILLGLLDQAAQTQLSLQPMMSALVLRFEEINQALEEMAEEGELMLKEHGDYMDLPSGMMGPANMQIKSTNAKSNLSDPPPDLLQQLLHHSAEKMRLAGGSVQSLGDTTLEEAIKYYSSLSNLLLEKLQAKQAVEKRLAQVLARVEVAAMRKCNPEDSTLHSEDSGIGGENESVTGSDQHRHHRGSAGSGSCGSGINIYSLPNNSPNLIQHNKNNKHEEENNDEDYGDDNGDRPTRKRSNSSPPDPSQSFRFEKDERSTVKRPQTTVATTKNESPSFLSYLNIMMEHQSSHRGLNLGMNTITEIHKCKELAGPLYNLHGGGQRRHSLNGSPGAPKDPSRENQSPYCLPTLAPHPPKRHSVRRLINTFSQGVDGRPGQSLSNVPPHIRKPKKSGILLFSDTVNGIKGNAVINGSNNSWHNRRDDLDVDNLPPPPPEVLMDNSFQSTDGLQGNEGRSQQDPLRSLPMIIQTSRVSQRLRASVQNVEVLPCRASVKQRSISILPDYPVQQDTVLGVQDAEQQSETGLDPDMEKANCLYRQARKIIHLRNAAESHDRKKIEEHSSVGHSPTRTRRGQICESNDFFEDEVSSNDLPVTATPASTCHRYSNISVLRPEAISGFSSCPGSSRMVTHAVDSITEEIIPSVSFRDARSVFCINEPKNIPGPSILSKPWEEASRGRLPMRAAKSNRCTH